MTETITPDMDLDIKLMAYADGALGPGETAEIEALLEKQPALKERVDRHRVLSRTVAKTYAPILDEPIPDHLTSLILWADLSPSHQKKPHRENPLFAWWTSVWAYVRENFRLTLPQAGAMAACFALGILIAKPVEQSTGGDQIAFRLSPAISQALTERPAGANGTVEIGLTYKDMNGAYCRTFILKTAHAGIACRAGEVWVVDLLVSTENMRSADGVRMASSLPVAVIDRVENRKRGEVLDRAQEAELLENGWH